MVIFIPIPAHSLDFKRNSIFFLCFFKDRRKILYLSRYWGTFAMHKELDESDIAFYQTSDSKEEAVTIQVWGRNSLKKSNHGPGYC